MTEHRLAAIQRLRETFTGDVVTPDDPRYDQARRVWNGMVDKRPAVIVRPTSASEVATAIRFGRDNELAIAIRCGGHSLPGLSTCDDGLVIDLSHMRGVKVDPGARIARARGGALLSELDVAAQEVGLVCPVGVVGHTGVGGLTLGGGMGRLQRHFGLTIDNLLSVDMVTADGRALRASETENPDLFWGMRGAGANFGVATSFEFRLNPMQPMITRGTRIFPADRAAEVWAAYRDFSTRAPDHLHLGFTIAYALPEDGYPDPISSGPIVTLGFIHSGVPSTVDVDLAPLADMGPAALEAQGLESYVAVQTSLDAELSWGHRYYSKGGFIDDLPADAVERIVEHVADGAGIGSWGTWTQGGAMGRVADDATAFTGRSALLYMSADSKWDQAAQDDERSNWVRQVMAIGEPFAGVGHYVNETQETGDQVTSAIYGAAKIDRLRALKRVWDPDNVFRLNQNIKP